MSHSAGTKHYGKHRGLVVSTLDPDLEGKITISITLGGAPLQMVAKACTPYPGFYAIPPEGSGVWIEFEEGDLDKPIWTGCYWRPGEVMAMLSPDLPPPSAATAPKTVVFSVAPAGFPANIASARLKFDTVTGFATLETLMPPASPSSAVRVQVTPAFVEISFGPTQTIRVTQAGVVVNDGALTVI